MRERVLRAGAADFDDEDYAAGRHSRVRAVVTWLLRRPVDSLAGLIATGGTIMILVNALFLQSGPHPAPIFANKPALAIAPVASNSLTAVDTAVPRARPADLVAPSSPPKARPAREIVTDIQRELSRRGFYDGATDGAYGPRTDAAIRDFEQAAGLRPSAEPSETLLQSILASSVKSKPVAPKRSDPIANLLATNPRVMAVQRALSSYGYGQIKPTGVYDPETRTAIESFERERRLPVTGQVSDRLVRELAALTGRPLE